MYEGMTGYAESATAGLNGGYSGRHNPDYGAYLSPKCYLEERNAKLYALMQKVKAVFISYEEGEYGYGADCAQKAVDALTKIVADAQNENWTEKPKSWYD